MFLVRLIGRRVVLIHARIGDADSDHVMKVMSAKFLACETALISFILNEN